MNMKNERHYGWGNEYYDCYNRFTNLGNNVYRFDAPLFHLCHPRKENSSFRPKTFHHIFSNELFRISNSSNKSYRITLYHLNTIFLKDSVDYEYTRNQPSHF